MTRDNGLQLTEENEPIQTSEKTSMYQIFNIKQSIEQH